MDVLLFAGAQHTPPPRAVWNASNFFNVDDTVRGGSSKSNMTVTDKCAGIDFSGFLDTTALGVAGFASQAYAKDGKGFPGSMIDIEKFSGIRLVVAALDSAKQGDLVGKSDTTTTTTAGEGEEGGGQQPGGGKGPVTKYTLNLKTEAPKQRPDGRRESGIVYEADFVSPKSPSEGEVSIVAAWDQFKPTYRGRPAPDAKPLDPSQVKEWSIMARSNFTEQSGPFSLRLVSLSAVSAEHLQKRNYEEADHSYISSPGSSGSGEYYGFALFIVATVAMVLWVIWALTPDSLLKRLGVDWYPNREWAFLIPAWSLFAVLFVYAAFMSLNMHNNPPLDDLRNVVDSRGNIARVGLAVEQGEVQHPLHGLTMAQTGDTNGPLAEDIYDLPPGFVSRERHGLA